MTGLRTLFAARTAAILLLAFAFPADAQVRVVSPGINPWTGRPYRNVVLGNPWSGRFGTVTTTVNPWTGGVHTTRMYNPWVGRTVVGGGVVNPWTRQPRWVNRRGVWW
jgi:hypothetical protein